MSADATGGAALRQQQTGAIPAAHQARNVCKNCNEGWMARLEDAAKLLLVGFIEGKQKTLAPFDQLVIGLWTVKTCLMYDAAQEQRLISPELETRRLFTFRHPVPRSLVVIGPVP